MSMASRLSGRYWDRVHSYNSLPSRLRQAASVLRNSVPQGADSGAISDAGPTFPSMLAVTRDCICMTILAGKFVLKLEQSLASRLAHPSLAMVNAWIEHGREL